MRKGHCLFVLATFLCLSATGCVDDSSGHNVPAGECGDGIVEGDEICDDGNTADGDGCASDCRVIEAGYECPPQGGACQKKPAPGAKCGNALIDEGETCDDGNVDSGDGCSSACQVEEGWRCDTPGMPCVRLPYCGDRKVDEGEECDDGNSISGDGCSSTCQIEEGYRCEKPGYACIPLTCGDGVVDAPYESCDHGESNVEYSTWGEACSTACQPAHYCGDGKFDQVDMDYGEECDDGADTSSEYNGCSAQCKRTFYCGDGRITHGETCDDGNSTSGDGCSSTCQIEPGYFCTGTPSVCSPIKCGNGILDEGEMCDDGNRISGDGCSSVCFRERGYRCDEPGQPCVRTCGDGIIEEAYGESCEDGNTVSGDGCSEFCVIEAGYICPEIGKPCVARSCGDGIVATGEECDDGNTVSGDGCSSRCVREAGWHCPTPGKPCVRSVCGNGIVEGDETCDEGENTTAGCKDCKVQMGWQCLTPGAPCTNDAICGNGKIEGAEECDEGTNATAGCVGCIITTGWHCPGEGKACFLSPCGDGFLAKGEECDDGNIVAGDGCSPLCEVEPIFSCTGGVCKPTCGDGLTLWEAGEECDDGNLISGDGCDSQCRIEPGFECTTFTGDQPSVLSLPIVYRDFIRYTGNSGSGDGYLSQAMYDALPANCKGVSNGYRAAYPPEVGRPSPDFYSYCPTSYCEGAVLEILGADGTPDLAPASNIRTAPGMSASEPCHRLYTCQTMFKWWYQDVPGINRTIKGKLNLTLTNPATGRYEYSNAAFYPINGQGYTTGTTQNGEFTSEFRTYFKYKGGEVLTFNGDDDVWVFFNGILGVDVGGIHGAWERTITLDTATAASRFKMFPGGIYSLSMFHAERCTGGSSFRLTLTGFVNMGTSECRAICGDGLIRGDEECDPGPVSAEEAIRLGCVNCKITPYCGNGKIEGIYEECDDPSDPDCVNCKWANSTCGNGIKEGKEQCDGLDGITEGQVCLPNCRISGCGDGIVSGDEECDDGNDSNDDMCTTLCKFPFCGDGIVTASLGEVCDDGINDGSYNGCGLGCSYLPPRCGDAVLDALNGEACDDGINSGAYGTCNPDCTLAARCGDGILQPEFEQCDEGENNGKGRCAANCMIAIN